MISNKSIGLVSALLSVCTSTTVLASSMDESLGDFNPTTMKKGEYRLKLVSSKYEETGEIFQNQQRLSTSSESSENLVSLDFGLKGPWEIGVALPFVDSEYTEKDPTGSTVYSSGGDGFGNLTGRLKYGKWLNKQETRSFESQLFVYFPTDSRDENEGEEHGGFNLTLTYAGYHKNWGLGVTLGVNGRGDDGFSGIDTVGLGEVFIEHGWREKFYLGLGAGRWDESDYYAVFAELKLKKNLSIEAYFNEQLESGVDANYYSLGLNYRFTGV